MRQRFCKICRGWHYLDRPWPDNCRSGDDWWLRSEHPSPSVQSDSLPGGLNGIVNMADGKRYDSKSRYLTEVKARGCEVLGNDTIGPRREVPFNDRQLEAACAQAIEEETQRANIRPDHTEGPDVVRGL